MLRRWSEKACALGLLAAFTGLALAGGEIEARAGKLLKADAQAARASEADAVGPNIAPATGQVQDGPGGIQFLVHQWPEDGQAEIADGGRYHEQPEPCPEDALFSQRCATKDDYGIGNSLSDLETGNAAYESFWDVRGTITGLSWYGVFTDVVGFDCGQVPQDFEITFYEDDGGTPGTAVAVYTATVTGEATGMDFGMAYATRFAVELSSPIEMVSGWVSIVGAGDPDGCIFGWLSDPMWMDPPGDGRCCYLENGQIVCQDPGSFPAWDLNICLLGTPYPGACCDDVTGTCQDGIEYADCLPPNRFEAGLFCGDLDPQCGQITGACCEGDTCQIRTPGDCLAVGGIYKGNYVPCDPNPCVGACCMGLHVCELRTEADCLALGGEYHGDGTTCNPNPCPPVNDDCANAEAVTEGDWEFDTTYATLDGPEVCGLGQNIWFCYTATATGTVEVVVEQYGGAALSGAAYDGCVCDPFPQLITCAPYGESMFSFDVQAGSQYLIEVGHSYGELSGAMGALHITLEPWAYGACCSEEAPYCAEAFEPECAGTFAGDGTVCGGDCNNSGVPDACDISSGLSQDCNGNGVPDECDIAGGLSDDYDLNGVPDECDPDCNNNGIIDGCDIDCGIGNCSQLVGCGESDDCQPDGIPDECQLGGSGGDETIVWDNGAPGYEDPYCNVLFSQFGGWDDGALVIDDIDLPEGATIDTLHAYFEDTFDFEWAGQVRVEIYADTGGAGPDQVSGPIVQVTIPDDVGSVARTYIGDGPYGTRYAYDLAELGIELSAGVWWIGVAPVGGTWGNAGWSTSQSLQNVVMSECFIRWPGIGLTWFAPVSEVWGVPWDVAFTVGTTSSGGDCNENQIPDDCDIMHCDGSSWCQDCNGNGVPDGCEPDCNANGIADECDIRDCDGSLWCQDCNDNGIPDGCEPDCDGNGVPDDCDLRDCDGSPWCSDCNQNDTIDACDIAGGASDDYDLNGVPDECDPDCNGNGVPDACDLDCGTGNCGGHPLGCGTSLDCQLDGIPDDCQLTGEHDYLTDDGSSTTSVGLTNGGYFGWLTQFNVEEGYEVIDVINLSWGLVPAGTPATVYIWSDFNGDGNPYDAKVLAYVETVVVDPGMDMFVTVDIPDTYIGPAGTSFFVGAIAQTVAGDRPAPIDTDASQQRSWLVGDTANPVDPNYLGTASVELRLVDNDIAGNWLVRAVGVFNNDCNVNGIPDDCDIPSGVSADCDANGVPDECEWHDCDGNGILDACDIAACPVGETWCADCNANGIPDGCDIAAGMPDCQDNGVPDECEEDCNANGVPDDCDMRDCDGSAWCNDCNDDDLIDACQVSLPGGAAYLYDDGTAERSIGEGDYVEAAWIQRYDAVFGSETIISIATCFGNAAIPGWSGVYSGQPFRVFIWDDPDNDRDPSDAVLLGSTLAYVDEASIDSDILQEVLVDPVEVSGSFFIGASTESSMWPAPADYSGEIAREAWWSFGYSYAGGFDPGNFTATYLDNLGFPINFVLRAYSQPGPGVNDCNQNGIPDECDLCGDLDGDGDVDYEDYVIFLSAFGGVTDGVPAEDWCCDYDDSGAVGMADFDAWLACYRSYVNDPLAGPPTIGKRRIRVPLSPLPKRGLGPVPSP